MKKYIIFMLIGLMAILSATDMVVIYTDGSMVSIPVGQVEQITFEQYEMVTVEGIELQWRTDDEYLYVNVSAPTTGWVAVGFDPVNQMADANIIIGYVDDGGDVSIRDDFGTGSTTHASDESLGGTDNVMDHYGMEDAGTTMLHFKIPLDSGDMYDKVLVPDNNYNVILAYGSVDNFTGFHTMATGTNIGL
ncbi:MAG: DOMON domain-containing protein [Candidatus Tenebribacter mawsonii]|nr:DOMON domain-containing protein [Candidatus Tenebribacter mawsonii]